MAARGGNQILDFCKNKIKVSWAIFKISLMAVLPPILSLSLKAQQPASSFLLLGL
jgi:hypothetical protein